MGPQRDNNEEQRVNHVPSPNNAHIQPHSVRLRSRSPEGESPAPEIIHYVGEFRIPPSLYVPPPQRMSIRAQISLMVGIHETLSRHPEMYRPYPEPGWIEAPVDNGRTQQVHQRQHSQQTNTNWNFGQGQILSPNVQSRARAWQQTGGIRFDVLRRNHLNLANTRLLQRSPPRWVRRVGAISLEASRADTPPAFQENHARAVPRLSSLRSTATADPPGRVQVLHGVGVINGRISKSQSPKKWMVCPHAGMLMSIRVSIDGQEGNSGWWVFDEVFDQESGSLDIIA